MAMSGGDGGGMGNPPMMMMQMSFYWGKQTVVLFSGWPGENLGMYLLCLLFIFFLSAVLEILRLRPTGKKPAASSTISDSVGRSIIHGLRIGLAYLVMLAVMSFNGGVFIAAVLGHTFGFLIVTARAVAGVNRVPGNISIGDSDQT